MGAFISKQPNGLYCRFSTVTDCVTHYNMTEDDYVSWIVESAKEEAKDILLYHTRPFEEVTENFMDNNISKKQFEGILKEMNTKKED